MPHQPSYISGAPTEGTPLLRLRLILFFLGGVFLFRATRHMEVPRLGVKSELQLLAYTTATAMLEPSHVCDLHYSHSNTRSLTH